MVAFDADGIGVTFSVMGFAFACHPGIIQIMHDLDRNTPQRMAKVLSRALVRGKGLQVRR